MISDFDIIGKDPAKIGYYVGLMVSNHTCVVATYLTT